MYRKTLSIIALMTTSLCLGQDLSQMATTELNAQVQSLTAQGNWETARTYANELISRFESTTNESNRNTLYSLFYLRAYSYVQDFEKNKAASSLDMAIEDLNRIIEGETSPQIRDAIDLKAYCFESKGDFKSSAEALGTLLKPPFIYKIKPAEQLALIRRIVSNLYAQRDWNGNEKWFLKLLNDSNSSEDKMMAASALMQGAILKKDYDEAMKYLPYTTIDAPARYDIALNISFLNAARALATESVARYADASVFYSLTYDKAKIVEFFTEYKAIAEKKYKEAEEKDSKSLLTAALKGRVTLAENQLKGLKEVKEYAPVLMMSKAINYQATNRMYESYWAYTQMIDYFPNSEQIQEYYYSAFQAAIKIEKEEDMASLGVEYMEKFPKGKFIKNIKLQMITYYHQKDMLDDFFATAYEYIPVYNTDSTCAMVIYLMGSVWIMNGDYDSIIRTFESYLQKYPKSSVQDSLHYWVAMGNLGKGDFAKSYEHFKILVTKYKNSDYAEDASYRLGIAAYGNQDVEEAMNVFSSFVKEFPHSDLAGEAEFFLGDLCIAIGESNAALEHYSLVEKKTSNQTYIDNAYLQSISIHNQANNYAEVVTLADNYIEKYPNDNVAMLLFERANALNETGRQGETLLTYKDIILKYGADADLGGVDKAIEEYINNYDKTKEKLSVTKEFIEKTLEDKELLSMLVNKPGQRYRYFLENPIIDKGVYLKFKSDENFSENLFEDITPLKDLLAHVEKQIAKVPTETPVEFFNKVLNDNKGKNPTLEFRAMMALDKFLKSPIPTRTFNSDDYKWASSSTLIWIAKQNEKYSAQEALNTYNYILDSQADSQYMFESLMGIAHLYEKQSKYEEALAYFDRLENEYPSDRRAWLATMEYGEALVGAGKIDLAREKFESIRRNPGWRGEPFAAALYNLAKLAEGVRKYEEALNFYDNCAIGHANFTNYSGKAALAEIKLFQKLAGLADDSEKQKEYQDKAKETAEAYLSTASAKNAAEYQDILDLSNSLQ